MAILKGVVHVFKSGHSQPGSRTDDMSGNSPSDVMTYEQARTMIYALPGVMSHQNALDHLTLAYAPGAACGGGLECKTEITPRTWIVGQVGPEQSQGFFVIPVKSGQPPPPPDDGFGAAEVAPQSIKKRKLMKLTDLVAFAAAADTSSTSSLLDYLEHATTRLTNKSEELRLANEAGPKEKDLDKCCDLKVEKDRLGVLVQTFEALIAKAERKAERNVKHKAERNAKPKPKPVPVPVRETTATAVDTESD